LILDDDSQGRIQSGIWKQAKGEEQKQKRNQEASEGGGTETKKTGTLNVGRSGEGFEVGLKERKAAGGILHF